jgi:anti-anti-sigma factor
MGTSDRRNGSLRVVPIGAPEGRIVLQLVGELDLSTVSIFVDAMDDVLDGEPVDVDLDLTELTFLDSSGIGAYVTAYRRAQAKGSRLSLGPRSGIVDRVLQLSGVEDALADETAERT